MRDFGNYRPLVLTGEEPPSARAPVQGYGGDAVVLPGLSDPGLARWMREGNATASGAVVTVETALKNTAVFRAVSLISYAIGMLPLQVMHEATKEKADEHPLYRLLHREPNNYQTAFDFRTLMQSRALVRGNAYALIVRGIGTRNGQIQSLVPLDPTRITPRQNDDWSVSYDYRPAKGGKITYGASDILHLRGMTLDGISGLSMVEQAAEAIGLAMQAERAAARLFQNGVMAGGALKMPAGKNLSKEAFDRLKADMDARYASAENAQKWMILEEGLEAMVLAQNSKDSQLIEGRQHQVEEIARISGVPRPLLMMDETSWGSGIEALGRFFVTFALNPWFEAWQQAAERSLLTGAEKDDLAIKFNPAALLRGSTTEQADFFAKALGAGGQPAWMTVNEVRDLQDMASHPDGSPLNRGSMGAAEGTTQ